VKERQVARHPGRQPGVAATGAGVAERTRRKLNREPNPL